jgi:hypothetical protein
MKKLFNPKWTIILSLLVSLSGNAGAQTDFIWGKQFGTDKYESGFNTLTDQSGNVYVVGYTTGDLSGKSFGKTDSFITKLDSTGNVIWTKQFGTPEDDWLLDLTIDNTGNLYVTGATTGVLEGKNFGKEDIMIVKIADAGNIEWQKQYGTDSTEVGNAVYLDMKGDIYIVGVTKGLIGKSAFGKADCFILKLDNNGNKILVSQFGTTGDDVCEGITADEASTLYLCGITTGDLAAKNKGKSDAFVGKFNSNGEMIKLVQFGTDENDRVGKIAVDKEKNIFAGGSTAGALEGVQQGQGDAFLTKMNENLDIIWIRQFGTPKWDGINGLDINEKVSDNILVSGCQNWPSCQSYIRMYKKDGTLLWVKQFVASGINGGTCGVGVCIDDKGNIYHTGNTGANLFNSNQGDHDIFIIKQALDLSQTNH